jgi:hypothetical protein
MIDPITSLIIVVAVAVGLALMFWIASRLKNRRVRAWRGFARRHGLSYQQASETGLPVLEGSVDGRPFRLRCLPDGSEDAVETVEMSMALNGSLPRDLFVHRCGQTIQGLADILGADTLDTGDQTFDQEVAVHASDQEEALSYLTDKRKQALQELLSENSVNAAGIGSGTIFVQDRQMWTSTDRLEHQLQSLRSAAPVLDA